MAAWVLLFFFSFPLGLFGIPWLFIASVFKLLHWWRDVTLCRGGNLKCDGSFLNLVIWEGKNFHLSEGVEEPLSTQARFLTMLYGWVLGSVWSLPLSIVVV